MARCAERGDEASRVRVVHGGAARCDDARERLPQLRAAAAAQGRRAAAARLCRLRSVEAERAAGDNRGAQ